MPLVHESVWSAATEEFRRRQVTSLRRCLLSLGVDTHRLEELLDVEVGSEEDVLARVAPVVAASVASPGLPVLLAFYLLLVAREKWENSTEWPLIRQFLTALRRAVDDVLPRLRARDPHEAAVVSAVGDYAQVVIACTRVENALNCSCPVDVGEQAGAVVAGAARSLEAARSWPPELHGPAGLLAAVAGTDHAYYSRLTEVGRSVSAVVGEQDRAWEELRRAADRARAAEADGYLEHDVYGTELRAHRLTLEALETLEDQEWLHADLVRVIYCYPFCVSAAPSAVLEQVQGQSFGAAGELAGLRPVAVHPLRLTDMWEDDADRGAGGPDDAGEDGPASGRRPGTYHGWVLELPDVTIRTTDPAEHRRMLTARSEIRFSALGNHHLRLELTLRDAHVHYVNQALRRPMKVMGYEGVRGGGSDEHPQLLGYADEVIGAVRGALGDPPGAQRRSAAKDAHVLLSVRSLSVGRLGDPRTPAGGQVVLDHAVVGGSLLRQPVRQAAATLEEWVRYPGHAFGTTVLEGVAFQGDVVVRTANSTVLAMPGVPDFLVKAYEEAAEFIATLPVLLTHWRRQVERAVDRAVAELDGAGSGTDSLYRRRSELQQVVARVSADLAGLHAPALTKTLMGRQFLDRLSAAAGIEEQEAHLRAQLDYASATQERFVTATEQARTSQESNTHRNLALLGGVVGAAGLADAFALANSPFRPPAAVIWGEVTAVLLAAILIVVIGLHGRHRRDR